MTLNGTNLILFILLTGTFIFSQTNKQYAKIKVTYSVDTHIDKNKEIYKIFEKFSPGLVARAEAVDSEINFTLIFKDSISIFYLEKKLFSDNRAASFVIRNSCYYGRVKQQPNDYITEELQEAFGKYLVTRTYLKWKLQDETKLIGEYLCFKATTFYTVTNPNGKVFKYNFTAWYAPQLPYKYGPAGYGNLPGLIMEIQGENFTYGVKKIVFYDDEESKKNEMPKLRKLKLISEEEFEGLAAIDEKRWQEQKN